MYFKKSFYFCLISFLSIPCLFASNSTVISKLLEEIQRQSLELKISENNHQSSLLEIDRQMLIFDAGGFVKGSYSGQELAPTSPYAASNNRISEYSTGLQKKWKNGVQSDVSYSLRDSFSGFSSRADFSFLSPQLELKLAVNVFQDFLSDRYQYFEERNHHEREGDKLQLKIEKKTIYTKALLNFSILLEKKEELDLQVVLCQKTKVQKNKLEEKKKRRSISNREYLQGVKELNSCQATIELLSTSFLEQKEKFESVYNISFEKYQDINSDTLFEEVSGLYQKIKMFAKARPNNLQDKDEIKFLEIQYFALQEKQKELAALKRSRLEMEFKSGLVGVDNSLSSSHEHITSVKYPYVFIGLKLDLPFSNRDAEMNSSINLFQMRSLEYKKTLTLQQYEFRFLTLKKTLEKDFLIFQKYKKSIGLSYAILEEARKDFSNGRIDFNSLTEFNKSLIQDQKVFSSHRIQLIVRVIEFLDYYHFFDQYLL